MSGCRNLLCLDGMTKPPSKFRQWFDGQNQHTTASLAAHFQTRRQSIYYWLQGKTEPNLLFLCDLLEITGLQPQDFLVPPKVRALRLARIRRRQRAQKKYRRAA